MHRLEKKGARGLITWAADGKRGIVRRWGEREENCVAEPCFALCAGAQRVYGAGGRRGYCVDMQSGHTLFDFSVPPGVCALCLFGGRLLALSSEADCLCAFERETGQLVCSAPAGVYPRDFCVSPCGKYAAVAGGAAGEILLFDQALSCVQRKKAAGIPCALCFLPRQLAVLCAVEEKERLSSRLVVYSPRGVEEEVFSLAQSPCALCALTGGKCLVGCEESVTGLSETHRAVFRFACGYPSRIRLTKRGPLICDAGEGTIIPLFGKPVFEGGEFYDVCVTR